ncbi:biofilm regulation protein phosphatase SiaA [Orrella marina]|uniref:Histidine kinase n=1 Tax=Orrella marina TaxID=2163011 RepID=A0A2R4XFW4_9BURK|nr:biofilm regulation protein phosphatase SiaA [Orrella marina]AWB32698.1 histidine kinase [Orrella marina]
MAIWGRGLRAKALLALMLACLMALLPASLIGWQVLESVRNYFGNAYAVNFTQLKRQSIMAPVAMELALSQRFADSVLTRQWLLDEQNKEKKALFFNEAEGYRKDFSDQAYFVVSDLSQNYYSNDNSNPYSESPRYTLEKGNPTDAWFFSSMDSADAYNINVDLNSELQTTRVWLNVSIRENGHKIGIAGTGIDLSSFLEEYIAGNEAGVTTMIINETGAIQAHRDEQLIAFNQTGSTASPDQTLAGHLPEGAPRAALAAAMKQAQAHPGEVSTLLADLDGKEQLLALSYIPELKWFVVTAVDLKSAQVLDKNWLNAAILTLVVLISIWLLFFLFAMEKLVLQPLRKLRFSATAMAKGDFEVSLPPPGGDELGDLSRAFGIMAEQVRSNTEELENKVQARTQALESANQDMRRAHQKINDSIDYASLIQRAILPDQQLRQLLGPHHFVLWRPRDVVGGDFYIFRVEGERYLVGVIDCAGHGVPGALMTMLARSALDHAMNQVGIASPASILSHTDNTIRGMLQQCDLPRAIATNMDAGLAYVDRENRILRYAGAKIGLYWSDGQEVGEIKGGRRAIGDRRQGVYVDTEIRLRPGVTYYLVTDGFLDQAGGDRGYGFGNSRFAQLLLQHARLPMEQQASKLDQALEAYRGNYPQRDDITILSFRFE